jgi:gamma-glutamyltranspeptidase/glutathione hydrolase
MLQQLAMLAGFDLDRLDPTSADFVHTVVECAKLAYADREAFYGDPDFVAVPMATLLSPAYNVERRRLVGKEASQELRPGSVGGKSIKLDIGQATRRADLKRAAGAGEPTVARLSASAAEPVTSARGQVRGDTVHLDIIDRHGNMVSATPSGGWLQSSPVIPELGFCLGTRGQMFWLDAAAPAALAPGKRPRSTLSPGLALRDGKPYLAFGTPGGDQQDQWSTQLLLRHAHAGMSLQEAIDCPAFHTEHILSSFWPRTVRTGVVVVEGRMPKATVAELERRDHTVEVGEDWSEGRLTAAARDGKLLKAAANPRGMQGYAVGR